MRWIGSAIGILLAVLGGIGARDFFVAADARIGNVDGNALWLFAPAVAATGVLLVWTAQFCARRPSREKMNAAGTKMGVAGIGLGVLPVVVAYLIDESAEAQGSFATISAAYLFGEAGACLTCWSLGLLFRGGAFS